MAHSLIYQISETSRALVIEAGKLLDLGAMLRDFGDDDLATTLASQAHRILKVAAVLGIAEPGSQCYGPIRPGNQ
jgi:hypothetical protein